MARDVFISYKNEDKQAAERICAALEGENISCWMAPRDITIGQEWAAAIVAGLQDSNAFVLLLSSNSKNARQVAREAELADRQKLPIVTFRLEDVEPPPELLYFLGNVQWLDGFGGQFDKAVRKLADFVLQHGRDRVNRKAEPSDSAAINVPIPAPAAPISSAPLVTPVEVHEAGANADGRGRGIVIGAAVLIVLAIILWLVMRHASNPAPEPNDQGEQAARAEAERWLSERNSGNLDAAWNEFTPARKREGSQQVWSRNVKREFAEYGNPTGWKLHGCSTDGGNRYLCDYAASYNNGKSANVRVVVTEQTPGTWRVDLGTREMPPK